MQTNIFQTLAAATAPQTFVPKELKHGKYTVTIQQGKRYPYSVLGMVETPKGKYSKFKTLFHYGYKTLEAAEKYAHEYLNRIKEIESEKAKSRAKQKEHNAALVASDHFKIDDIIVNTWGWEQTNVDFYKVTEVLNKKIRVVKIGGKMVEGSMMPHGMSCDVLPDPEKLVENRKGIELLSLKSDDKGRVWICDPERYYYFHKWDGRPQYCSWYA